MKRPILAAIALAAAVAAPATATAASIEVASPNGFPVIAYKARPGEVNALKMFGTGDDQLVTFAGVQVKLDGGDGDDLLVVSQARGPIVLEGGDDDDFAFSHVGDATVDAGSGNDVVEVQGGAATEPDAVTCGPGWDVAWLDEADTAAADRELKFRSAAPAFRKVAKAEAAAQALLAHDPDPTTR